ncbi:MAG: HAD-IA family hydrolase [Chloroflexaceae bacterium]|nr:HAD-IA family hydrolase [Chloroflexaceae bacterium]
MPQLQALIFDVDGTLAETERDGHRVAFNRAFADAGLDWDWSVAAYQELLEIAGGKERICFYLQSRPVSIPDLDALIARLHQGKSRYYQQILSQEGIAARPGVKRSIAEARRAGLRLAIATTAAPENAIALLKTSLSPDAPHWFEVIAAGDIVPAKKPAPDIYRYVLQQMELGPENCLVIEDSHNGLEAARQAGLTTVITVNDYTQNQDFTGAALVINHLGEPNLPFTVLGGNARGKSYFDLELASIITHAIAKYKVCYIIGFASR